MQQKEHRKMIKNIKKKKKEQNRAIKKTQVQS